MSTTASTMPPATLGVPAWVPSRLHRITIDEYERMVASGGIASRNRFHLINGYLVDKMTHNPPHAVADERCGRELLRIMPPGWHLRTAQAGPAPRPGQRARARSLRRARDDRRLR